MILLTETPEEYTHNKKRLELINKFNKFARLHYQYTKTNSMSIYHQDTTRNLKKKKKENSSIYNRASLVAQLVKNLPAIQETWVRSLHWEHPLEKGKSTHSSILAWGISWVHGVMTFTFTFQGNSDPITVFLIVWAVFSVGRAFPPLAFCLENSL